MSGLFISFEGIDGCGKSTLRDSIADALRQSGKAVLCTHEPGGSRLGQQLRDLLLHSDKQEIDKYTETLLYAADRSLHVSQVILPALAEGMTVLCDRYVDSSYAYQGSGRQLPRAEIEAINRFASHGLLPDLTILLDLPAEQALARLPHKKDRIEQEDLSFFDRVAAEYRQLAMADPARFLVIDATQSIAAVFQQAMDYLQQFMMERLPC